MSFKEYTKEEKNKIKDMFNFLDKNNKGEITIEEVKMGIIGLGGELSNKEILELKNKSEVYKFDDFINLCQKKKINLNEIENKLLMAFSLLETKDKGFVTSDSLENLLRNENIPEDDINKIIKEAKPDKNKNIDYKSLVKDILEANSDDEIENNLNNDENNSVNNNKENDDYSNE